MYIEDGTIYNLNKITKFSNGTIVRITNGPFSGQKGAIQGYTLFDIYNPSNRTFKPEVNVKLNDETIWVHFDEIERVKT